MFPESLMSEKYTTVHSLMLHFHQNSPLVQLYTCASPVTVNMLETFMEAIL